MEGSGGGGLGRGVRGGRGQGTFHPPCHILHYHMVLRPKRTSQNECLNCCCALGKFGKGDVESQNQFGQDEGQFCWGTGSNETLSVCPPPCSSPFRFSTIRLSGGARFTTPTGGARFTTPTGDTRFTTPTGGARFTTPTGGARFTTPTGGVRFTEHIILIFCSGKGGGTN